MISYEKYKKNLDNDPAERDKIFKYYYEKEFDNNNKNFARLEFEETFKNNPSNLDSKIKAYYNLNKKQINRNKKLDNSLLILGSGIIAGATSNLLNNYDTIQLAFEISSAILTTTGVIGTIYYGINIKNIKNYF